MRAETSILKNMSEIAEFQRLFLVPMSNQYDDYLRSFTITKCLDNTRGDPDKVRNCYKAHFSASRLLCEKELEGVIELYVCKLNQCNLNHRCGHDNRLGRDCQREWRAMQRCMQNNGFWQPADVISPKYKTPPYWATTTAKDPNRIHKRPPVPGTKEKEKNKEPS
jgi:hypothetical protein